MSRVSTGLSLGSVRHRSTSYLGAFVAILVGSAVMTAFGAMLDTGLQPGVGGDDRTALIVMSSVVGGWGAVVVGAAVATTLAVTTRQRVRELALLRSIGATPRQVVRMMTGEIAAVAVVAVLVAVPVGAAASVVLVRLLQNSGQITENTHHHLGYLGVAIGAGLPIAAALVATWITARRATARRVTDALFDASTGGRSTGRVRLVAGWILFGGGVANAVTTAIVCHGANPNDSQAIASEGAIVGSIGLALLAPVLLEAALAGVAPHLGRRGVAGQLALLNLGQRTQQAATAIMPIIVLVGIATGTLTMQSVTNAATGGSPDRVVEMLNYVIVGIIVALAAAMTVNLLVVATAQRRREYAQARLLGATPDQLVAALRLETAVVTAVGIVAGTVGAALTAVPFSLAQGTGVLPWSAIAIHAVVIVAVVLLAFGTTLHTGRRAMRGNAVVALAAPA